MKTKYSYGFVGLENWIKSEDSTLNKCISLLIDRSRTIYSTFFDIRCEPLFNTKKYFKKGLKICKKYGLDAYILCVCYGPFIKSRPKISFHIISTQKKETNNTENIEKYLKDRSLGSVSFTTDFVRTETVYNKPIIFKKNGKYISHEYFEYTYTDSGQLDCELVDNIILDYIKKFPLKSRKITDEAYNFHKNKEDYEKDEFNLQEYLENYEPEDETLEASVSEIKNKKVRPTEEIPKESIVIKKSDNNEIFNLIKDNKIRKREINKDFNGNIKIKLNDIVGCIHCGKKYPASELLVYQINKTEKDFLIFCKNRPYCDGNICDIFSADDEDFNKYFTE